jgi:valyl-tRNA synthetase
MELSKHYIPEAIEERWDAHWTARRYFESQPDERIPFTVVIPPPNVTGVLHMGHTLNETIQDILVRRARMQGYNACWVPGSDHASIATEAKVVQMLKEKGLNKSDMSRKEFLRYAFEWKEKFGGIIYQQIRKLGCSVDWSRVSFTMDDEYYKAVMQVFVDLYGKGLIYRGARMIHWDPAAKTALSDEEVEYRDVSGKLYYVRYDLAGEDGKPVGRSVTIATQRPETIMGDTAVFVHPDDPRYRDLKGLYAVVPLVNRRVPVIFDEYVDREFGTGVLKVTPAHDINDYNLGLKHHLPSIDTLNEDGTLSQAAEVFVGLDRFEARKKVIEQLRKENRIVKEEDHPSRQGFSQRSHAAVEPRISTQWFLKMKDLAGPALNAVLEGEVKIFPPERFLNTYKYWLENVKDWCISRQLWWGQRIPAWYDDKGNFVVAVSHEEAVRQFRDRYPGSNPEILKQDEDVLDTWFSSWLWPMEVFKGISRPGNADIRYYYPTSVLVTGQDIIFFWVSRMIMAGMEYMHEKPFSYVYFTGMVRDKLGRKMSKSLGNSPDLLELIGKYGADAVRFGIVISSPAGNDLLFDEATLEQGRNFNNKLWNAVKLVRIWAQQSGKTETAMPDPFPVSWFEHRLREIKSEMERLFGDFKISEGLKTLYSLIWDDFCSWYLEWIKPAPGKSIDPETYTRTIGFFEELMGLLHPFMPFITEEIYHLLHQRPEGDDLCVRHMNAVNPPPDRSILEAGALAKEVIAGIRDLRSRLQLKSKDSVEPRIQSENAGKYRAIEGIVVKMTGSTGIDFTGGSLPDSLSCRLGADMVYISLPATAAGSGSVAAQRRKLEDELNHLRGFLDTANKKLNNERFIQNAKPEIVQLEQKKKSDAESKIRVLEESLAALNA